MTLKQELIAKWELSLFGVKTRVKDELGDSYVKYVIKNIDTYNNDSNVKALIRCIERHSEAVKTEAEQMHKQICLI